MAWAPDYLTVEQARSFRRVDDLGDDEVIALAISTSSRAIDDHTNRQFGRVEALTTRSYTPWPNYDACRWQVDLDDLHDLDGLVVEVGGTALAVDGYTVGPVNAEADGVPYTWLRLTDAPSAGELVAVTSPNYGWAAVPAQVEQACLIQTARLVKRRDSPFGISGSPELGGELRLLAKLDPDVAVSLRGLRRARAVG